MVLPNVTQFYFTGIIEQDALTLKPKFENADAVHIYTILVQTIPADLLTELEKQNIKVNNDMILLEVGQRLIEEKKADEALSPYQFRTKLFPNIIFAWNNMGDVYLMKGNNQEAINCYKQALKLRPENHRAKEKFGKIEII